MRQASLGWRLHGEVYGHPHHPDGTWVRTTEVIGRTSGDCYETRNSIYRVEHWARRPEAEQMPAADRPQVGAA